MNLAGATLAYTPILDPLPLHGWLWWLLLPPLALGVSMIYKAVRAQDMDRYWRETLLMTFHIVGAMVLLAFGIHVVVEWLLPRAMV